MSTSEESKALSGASAATRSVNLNPEEILKAEWDYIKGTASEAQEDRARVSTFFLGSAASLVAVLVGAKSDEITPMIYYGFATLLLLMGITGWLTLWHLIRLRAAWFESILSLNLIKEYYFCHFKDSDLTKAFNWRVDKGLRLFKPWSVSFLFAVQVALMTIVLFSGMVVCLYLAAECLINICIIILVGVVFGGMQILVYWGKLKSEEAKLLKEYKEKKAAMISEKR